MAPSYVKSAGTWKEIIEVYEKMGGVWTAVDSISLKVSGVYKEVFSAGGIDPNLLIMFLSHLSDRPADGILESGYYNKFPMGAGTTGEAGTTGGSTDHAHGSGGAGTAASSNSKGMYSSSYQVSDKNSYHSHTIAPHSHPNTASNTPDRIGVLPYSAVSKLYKGSIIFSDSEITGFTNYSSSYINRYVSFENLASIPASVSSHTHGTRTINTSDYTINMGIGHNMDGYQNTRWYQNIHNHSANHDTGAVKPGPAYFTQKMLIADSDIKEFPIGARTFLKHGASIPAGFGIYDLSTDRLLKISTTSSLTNDSVSHGHTDSGYTDYRDYTDNRYAGSNALYGMPNHRHSFSHTHGTANNMPRYMRFNFIERTE